MPLNENDLSFLIDIANCIKDINEFTHGQYQKTLFKSC